MSRLNGLVKFAMINVNIVLAFIGFFCFGFAMYLWCSDWGNLDRGFFVGSGLVVALFGLSMFFLGCIGCLGIDHQGRINKPCLQSCAGKWYKIDFTARKIIGVHLVVMILLFAGEVVLLRTALNASNEYSAIVGLMEPDEVSTLPYATYEGYLSKEFNRFFFGAVSDCQKTLYLWFFSWINENCPSSMDQLNCQGCHDYSLTFCEANENLCYKTTQDGNVYCPYTICRYGILTYFHSRIKQFAVALLVLLCLQLLFILLDLMILCYREHDNKAVGLLKAGIDPTQVKDEDV